MTSKSSLRRSSCFFSQSDKSTEAKTKERQRQISSQTAKLVEWMKPCDRPEGNQTKSSATNENRQRSSAVPNSVTVHHIKRNKNKVVFFPFLFQCSIRARIGSIGTSSSGDDDNVPLEKRQSGNTNTSGVSVASTPNLAAALTGLNEIWVSSRVGMGSPWFPPPKIKY